jgi:hypothetical protein
VAAIWPIRIPQTPESFSTALVASRDLLIVARAIFTKMRHKVVSQRTKEQTEIDTTDRTSVVGLFLIQVVSNLLDVLYIEWIFVHHGEIFLTEAVVQIPYIRVLNKPILNWIELNQIP